MEMDEMNVIPEKRRRLVVHRVVASLRVITV